MSSVKVWVWTVDACEGGDLDAIVAKAKAHSVELIVKIADGIERAGDWDPDGRAPDLVARCRAAGVPVQTWSYNYPTVDLAGQIEAALRLGTDHIFDVEVEWDGHAAEARLFVNYALARRGTSQVVGYAPLPIVSYHDASGQYEEFNRLDVACPQAYAGTGGRSAIGALEWTDEEWARAFPGCRIEPAVYAADQAASDLRSAIAYCFGQLATHQRAFGDGAVSIWSWQHMADEHWAVVDEFTKEESMLIDPNDPTWVAYQNDVRQSLDAVKAVLAEHAAAIRTLEAASGPTHDTALVDRAIQLIGQTLYLRPPSPPAPGLTYAGESSDFSATIWFDPSTGKDRAFRSGVEIPWPDAPQVAPPTPVPSS